MNDKKRNIILSSFILVLALILAIINTNREKKIKDASKLKVYVSNKLVFDLTENIGGSKVKTYLVDKNTNTLDLNNSDLIINDSSDDTYLSSLIKDNKINNSKILEVGKDNKYKYYYENVSYVKPYLKEINKELGRIDAKSKSYYSEGLNYYLKKLNEIDKKYNSLKEDSNIGILTMDDSLNYLNKWFIIRKPYMSNYSDKDMPKYFVIRDIDKDTLEFDPIERVKIYTLEKENVTYLDIMERNYETIKSLLD